MLSSPNPSLGCRVSPSSAFWVAGFHPQVHRFHPYVHSGLQGFTLKCILGCSVSPSNAYVCNYVLPQAFTFVLQCRSPQLGQWTPSLSHCQVFRRAFPLLPILSQGLWKATEYQATLILIAPGGRLSPGAQSCSVSPVSALLQLSSGNSACQSRPSQPPCMAAAGTRHRWGLSRMWGTWSHRPIVLALKGFTPHTGSVGFAGPRTSRWILATPLVIQVASFWCSSPRHFFLRVYI